VLKKVAVTAERFARIEAAIKQSRRQWKWELADGGGDT
jgi:hypothetical protein